MDYKEFQNYTREIIFRCHLATPLTKDEAELYVEGVTLSVLNKTAEVLRDIDETKKEGSTTKSIIDAVCSFYEMDEKTIKTRTRKRHIVEARQIAMHLLHRNTKYSLSKIGIMMGFFDHSTVIHASKTVLNLKSTSRIYAANLSAIKNSISCQ